MSFSPLFFGQPLAKDRSLTTGFLATAFWAAFLVAPQYPRPEKAE
jgi:hypothetical protein